MELKRKAWNELDEWHRSHTNKALLVTGARQVGKTHLVERFCAERYEHVVKFDLVEQPDVRDAFGAAKSREELFLAMSAYADAPLMPGKTVVFIDEVQECKEAITLAKYLVRETGYHFVLSGSLLGVELADLRSAPVGYVYQVEMHPLDFEEFCWSQGLGQAAWDEARSAYDEAREVNAAVHARLLELFHRYLIVGGMPDAVTAFSAEKNMQSANKAQSDILAMYRYDIAKYAARDKKLAIREIFDLMPSQLDSQSKRFNFSSIAPKGTYALYQNDFLWLVAAGVAILDRNVCEPKRPLKTEEDASFFKLYMNDVGLLAAACGMDTVRELVRRDECVNYGSFYENAVAQELLAHGHTVRFFRNRKLGELDFVVEKDGAVLPIEVKSGKTYNRHSALNNVLAAENYGIDRAFVLCEANVSVTDKVNYLPIYMVAFI